MSDVDHLQVLEVNYTLDDKWNSFGNSDLYKILPMDMIKELHGKIFNPIEYELGLYHDVHMMVKTLKQNDMLEYGGGIYGLKPSYDSSYDEIDNLIVLKTMFPKLSDNPTRWRHLLILFFNTIDSPPGNFHLISLATDAIREKDSMSIQLLTRDKTALEDEFGNFYDYFENAIVYGYLIGNDRENWEEIHIPDYKLTDSDINTILERIENYGTDFEKESVDIYLTVRWLEQL